MPVTGMLRLSFVLAVAMACSSDVIAPPATGDFANAVARAQCGPADGPAVEIFLSQNPGGPAVPSANFVRLYVPVQVNQLAERPWGVGDREEAGAWFQTDASHFEAAIAGALFVGSVDSENTIAGVVDLDFPNAGHVHGSFRATWLPTRMLCA